MMRLMLPGLFMFSLSAGPAAASWVHCSASGTGDTGPVEYETTIVNLRPATKHGKYDYPALLSAYVAHRDPDTRNIKAACASFEGNADAAHDYAVSLNAKARKLGWDHVTVLTAEDWLPADAIIEATDQP